MLRIIIFVLFFLGCCCENGPLVSTNNGVVLGSKFKALENSGFSYYAFQGIPFAEPPIGEKRFLPPQPKNPWKGILNATKDIPVCMQIMLSSTKRKASEDCLVLNVYTPNLNGSYPVMVYIFGGAFIEGSASKEIYGPDYLIQENVVLVVPNYRLGVFGFLSTQDEVVPGNNGLKDQIMALEWVKENIKFFGGNPDSVTIFGESAGSASVSLLLQAKNANGLFHGAIMESGVSLSAFSRTRNPLSTTFSTAKNLNIMANTSQDLVEKLRAVSAEKLLEASEISMLELAVLENPLNGLFYAPCIEPDHPGAVLTGNSHELLTEGQFSKVPVIVGFNSAEGNLFAPFLSKNLPLYLVRFDLDKSLFIPADMDVLNSLRKTVGNDIKKYYFGNKLVAFNKAGISKFITDDQFIRPTVEFVRILSSSVPTYLYEFSYVGTAALGTRKLPGVGHAEEVLYLWYHKGKTGLGLDSRDTTTSKRLVKLWTNFAKYRNPTPSKQPSLDNVIWEATNNVDFTYLQINRTLHTEAYPRKKDIDFWQTLYKTYGNPPYDTY